MTTKNLSLLGSRRSFLKTSIAASAVFAVPTIVPSRSLGRDGATAPSERIQLGVIGIGPRCTYDLKAMLNFSDVQCVAIADVQESRRSKGKALVDSHYGNQDCQITRDFRELLQTMVNSRDCVSKLGGLCRRPSMNSGVYKSGFFK